MCNINTIGLGIQAGNIVSSTIDRYSQDRVNLDYQKAKTQAILNNYANQAREINNAYSAEKLSNAVQRQNNYIKNLQAKSTLQANKASLGINGNSMDNMFRGYDRAVAVNNYLSARDLHQKGLAYSDRLSNLRYSALNSLASQRTYYSNGAPVILNGVSDLFGAYVNYKTRDLKDSHNL